MSNPTYETWKVTIIGGAIAGILTAAILALFAEVRNWFFYKAPYSNLTICALVLISIIAGMLLNTSIYRRVQSNSNPKDSIQDSTQLTLNEIDHHLIRGLISFDGEWADVKELSNRIGRSKLQVERSLQTLISMDYAKDHHVVGQGSFYKLSPNGTAYAVTKGLDHRTAE